MKLKLFTFRFSESSGGFNDEPLQKFIADKEVVEFTNHFFVHEKIPYLTVILSYRDISRDERQKGNLYRELRNDLDERETKAYDALRAWRAIKASQEGIPPYMIANNKQLAHIVKLQPKTKTDLAKVAGIGDAKITRYGMDILSALAKHFVPVVSGSDESTRTEEELKK